MRPTNGRVWNITVTTDLIRRVNNDDALSKIVGQYASDFTKHRRLANARAAKQKNAFTRLHDVLDDTDRAVNRATDSQSKTNDQSGPVANGRNTM